MAIEGFDYKEFATSMATQAQELVPADLNPNEKEYIVKTLGNFTMLAGEALYNDESLSINAEQAVFITQIIAEWAFHKSIDLIHSGILPEYWDGIMQKIAFTIFEIAKQAVIRKIPQDQLLQVVEHHVIKVYKECIEELQTKGIITEETKERAESQSNIDAMAQQVQDEKQKQQEAIAEQAEKNLAANEKKAQEEAANVTAAVNSSSQTTTSMQAITNKEMKLMSLAMVLKVLSQDKVTTILDKFDKTDVNMISQYMSMANLESQIDGDLVADCFREMKDLLPVKRKLTQENVVFGLLTLYKNNSREQIETIIKKERPLVKRFVSQALDGEYGELPLKVAGILEEYIEENIS